MTLEIQHSLKDESFYIELDSGEVATLKYQYLDQQSVDFYSTFVPNSHRGQGLAAKLVDAGFSWARQNGLELNASCSYAQRKLESQSQ